MFTMVLDYYNAIGEHVTSYLPMFNDFDTCMAWMDVIYYQVLDLNHITNFVGYCTSG